MNRCTGITLGALVLLPAALVALAIAAATPEQKCFAAKLKEVGKYDACLFKAYAAQVIKSVPSPDTSKCDSKFATNWAKPETKYGAACPTLGDQTALAAVANSHVASVFALLSGSSGALCGDAAIDAGEDCDGTELGGAGCVSLGFGGGTLACDGGCQFDTSACLAVGGCLTASDCPGADTECQVRVCAAGVCGLSFTTAGTPLSSQTAGDCKLDVCDGAGAFTTLDDNADVADDGNQCTDDACAAGQPLSTNTPLGIPCTQSGGTQCDGNGNCVP